MREVLKPAVIALLFGPDHLMKRLSAAKLWE